MVTLKTIIGGFISSTTTTTTTKKNMEERRNNKPISSRRKKKISLKVVNEEDIFPLNELHDDLILHTLEYFDAYDFVALYNTNNRLKYLIDDFPKLSNLLIKNKEYIDLREKSKRIFLILLELVVYGTTLTIKDTRSYDYDPDLKLKDEDLLSIFKNYEIKTYEDIDIIIEYKIFIDVYSNLNIERRSTYYIREINEILGTSTFQRKKDEKFEISYGSLPPSIIIYDIQFKTTLEDILNIMKSKNYTIQLNHPSSINFDDLYLKSVYNEKYKRRKEFFDTYFIKDEREDNTIYSKQGELENNIINSMIKTLYTEFPIFSVARPLLKIVPKKK
jgi:hypothetical protein